MAGRNTEVLVDGPEMDSLIPCSQENEKRIGFSKANNNFSPNILSDEGNNVKFLPDAADDNDGHVENGYHQSSGLRKPEEVDKTKSEAQQFTGWKRYLGMGLAIFSSAVFSLAILIVKTMEGYQVFSIGLWRFQGVLLPSLPLLFHGLLVKKERVFEPIHPLCRPDKFKIFVFLFLRAFFGCSAVLCHFYALKYLNIADATVIAFSTPVFVTFLAYIILGEQCGIINVVSAVLTFIGVAIIARPPFLTGAEKLDGDLLVGAGLALGAMMSGSCVFLVLRLLKGVHYSLTTFFFGLYGSAECLILSAVVGTIDLPRGTWDWCMAVTIAALTFIGQVCTTLALQYEEAGPIALCRTCDVIFSFIWQFLFLHVIPDIFSFGGSLIVMTGVFLVSFRKFVSMKPEKDPFRQKFKFVLK